MIGVDIVSIARIEKFIERFEERALDRFLTQDEKKSFKKSSSIAGIWAAKEAISKALGCGICADCGFLDIEIYKDSRGAPKVRLKKEVIERFSIKRCEISISHEKEYAIAYSFVECS